MIAEDSFIIPLSFFDEEKPFILIHAGFCEKNEFFSRNFVNSLMRNTYFNKMDYKESKGIILIKRHKHLYSHQDQLWIMPL